MTSKSDPSSTWADRAVAETYRADWGRLLSLLVTRTRRLDLAEDALGEAFVRASARWQAEGVPKNPSGWIYTTAYRLILGGLRAEAIHGRKTELLAVRPDWVQPLDADDLDDERLTMILLCCHPALSPEARSPLALRLVIGTTTEEIARLFLVSRSTMAARITRAKKKIVKAGIPLSSPVEDELRVRLSDVCRTIYVAFTAGYSPGEGTELLRVDLAGEAVELAAVLQRLVPEVPEVRALYGLLLLQHARRASRIHNGKLVTLPDQDRSLWYHDEIGQGGMFISGLPKSAGYTEQLRLQGMIALEHGRAISADKTDWHSIAASYASLETLTDSPIVRLNRAVAVAEAQGCEAGLALLDELDEALARNHRLHAVRADLARRSGDTYLARVSYTKALKFCNNDVEREYLRNQLQSLN